MTQKTEDYIQLPNRSEHNCFGCSPANASGLRMTFYTNEAAVYSKIAVPEHLCGWNNLVHGGVLTTIMDEIMSWAAIYLLKRVAMTKSIRVDFLKPVYVGNPLTAEGMVLDEVCCAKASGTFAVFSPAVAKRLSITDSESLKWFERIFELK
jgi:uncharacterized protein (TIGR00369 family)